MSGDCNSLHRIAQCYFHTVLQDDEPRPAKKDISLLVTFITKPFSESHTFVMFKRGVNWYWFDYGVERRLDEDFDIAIQILKTDYQIIKGVEIKAYALQDIDFKVIKVG